MTVKVLLNLLFFFISTIFVSAQVEETAPPSDIKTIMFKGNTHQSQLPILKLGEPLLLEFDALTGMEPDFYYVIEHFNYDWTPSNLVKSEYLRGFDNQRIQNYKNSFNTYQIYSHYMLQIPNQQTKALLVTGNYLLSIFNDDDELVFSRKFMVYEDLVNVGVSVKRSRDVKYIDQKQSVDIVVDNTNFNFNNPLENVKSLIIQNNNLNTAISNVKPQYTLGNQLVYKYTSETSFWGGNEYLYFETKDVRAANVGVQYIDLQDIYHTYLFVNTPRADQLYTYNPDINGNFVVTALDANDIAFEADYTRIHFALQHPELIDGKSIYVYGNFNNYGLEPSNQLRYNPESGLYEADLRLKQGFYNYKYVVTDAKGSLDEGAISGNFYQTENNYKVLVYYRDLGARYDRLLGIGEASSVDISN